MKATTVKTLATIGQTSGSSKVTLFEVTTDEMESLWFNGAVEIIQRAVVGKIKITEGSMTYAAGHRVLTGSLFIEGDFEGAIVAVFSKA